MLMPRCLCFWFCELYSSAGEPLCRDPEEERRAMEAAGDADFMHPDIPWMDADTSPTMDWAPDCPPVELHAQLAALANNPGADVGLPVRYLGHAPLIHYYWLFVANWDTVNAYSAFNPGHPGVQESSTGTLPCPCF